VLDELDWEPRIDAAQIGVTAHEGVVTLTGHVAVYAEKHMAGEVAKRVHGVRGVANEIEVRPSEAHVRDDEDLAAAAVHALQWDAMVPEGQLQVSVEDGWLKVEGTVQHRYQKEAVDRTLRHMSGVRGVANQVEVVPSERTSEIKAAIEAAFRRSATLNSSKLSVEVEDSKVTICGDVHSHGEMEEAERTAWSAAGVSQVQNCITLTPWGFGPAEEWGY
jgi:osmotically-inducible protein OsmY